MTVALAQLTVEVHRVAATDNATEPKLVPAARLTAVNAVAVPLTAVGVSMIMTAVVIPA